MTTVYSEATQVGNFDPSKLTETLAWWDVTDRSTFTLETGNKVSAWTDKVGGFNWSQATDGARPVYTLNAVQDRPMLFFDGTDDYMTRTATVLSTTSGEVWALAYLNHVGNRSVLSASDTAGDVNFVTFQATNATTDCAQINSYNAGVNNAVRASTTTLSTGKAWLMRWTSSGTAWAIQVTGTTESVAVVAGSNTGDWFGDPAGIDTMTLGALQRNSSPAGEQFFSGYLGPVVVCNTLNAAKAQALFNYFLYWRPT